MSAGRGPQPDESTPLLINNANQEEDGNNGCCAVRKWSLFYFFCFLSGQYVNVDNREERPSTKRKCVSVVGLILFIGQFNLHLGHVVTAMIVEVYRIGNITIYIDDYDDKGRVHVYHAHCRRNIGSSLLPSQLVYLLLSFLIFCLY